MIVRWIKLLRLVSGERDFETNTRLPIRRSIHFALRVCRGTNEHLGLSVWSLRFFEIRTRKSDQLCSGDVFFDWEGRKSILKTPKNS